MKNFEKEKELLLERLEISQVLLLTRVREFVKLSKDFGAEDIIEQACEHLKTGEELIYKISQLKERSLSFPDFMAEIAKGLCPKKKSNEPKDCDDGVTTRYC